MEQPKLPKFLILYEKDQPREYCLHFLERKKRAHQNFLYIFPKNTSLTKMSIEKKNNSTKIS